MSKKRSKKHLMTKFFLILTFTTLLCLSVFSQNNQIKDLEKKRKQTLKDIANTTQLLNDTKKTTLNLFNRISLLVEQINSRQQLIRILNQEIEAIEKEQILVEKEITQLQNNLKSEQKAYSKAIEEMLHNKQKNNELIYVLSGKSVGESMRRMKYLKDYSTWRSKQASNIKAKQKELNLKKAYLDKSKTEKQSLLANREIEQNNLKVEEDAHKLEMAEANSKQKELQDLLQAKQKQADNLNSQLERLIVNEITRQEKEAKRLSQIKVRRSGKSKRTRSSNSETKTTAPTVTAPELPELPEKSNVEEYVTTENLDLSSSFASNKGKLPMPIKCKYSIIGRFGKHRHEKWKVTTENGGIDIQAQAGADAFAVFLGEVTFIAAFPGYNNCIIVRHGSYFTLYANIQQIYVKQGQKIATGQALGKIFLDTDTNNSLLHFQLWKGKSKLNPEPWLNR